MLHNTLKDRPKEQANDPLPAAYALVFYHGKQTPYPYSMKLADCFHDPLGIMKNMFDNEVPLVDVNQIKDDELKKQQLLGIMTGALKHSRDRDINRYLIQLMEDLNSVDLEDDLALKFVRTVLNYLLGVGNIGNAKQFIEASQRLPEPVRSEMMTAAEKLWAMGSEEGLEKGRKEGLKEGLEKGREEGLEKGLEKGREEVALGLLKENVDPKFVAHISKLELPVIVRLKAQLEGKK